jgi:hypothetical protein
MQNVVNLMYNPQPSQVVREDGKRVEGILGGMDVFEGLPDWSDITKLDPKSMYTTTDKQKKRAAARILDVSLVPPLLDNGLTPKQNKFVMCLYYNNGMMRGRTTLFRHVQGIDIDTGQDVQLGDIVHLTADGRARTGSPGDPKTVFRGKKYTVYKITDDATFQLTYRHAQGDDQMQRTGGAAFWGANKLKRSRDTGAPLEYSRKDIRRTLGISRRALMAWLKNQHVWQLSQRPKREENFRPLIVKRPREYLQVDLIGPIKGCKDNKKFYALVVLDLFTRKMWTKSSFNKTAAEVTKNFRSLLNEKIFTAASYKEDKPYYVSSDNGTEFTGVFSDMLKKRKEEGGVSVRQVFGIPGKATNQAYVERSNQSVKSIMYKLMKSWNERCPSRFLGMATDIYNASYHSTIMMTPNDADDPGKIKIVTKNVQAGIDKKLLLEKKYREKENASNSGLLKVNDYVRIRKLKSPLDHRYFDNYEDQIRQVHKVQGSSKKNKLVRYVLKVEGSEPPDVLTSSNGVPVLFTRRLLQLVPSNSYESPPQNRATFRQWCEQCNQGNKACSLNYETFLADALRTKKDAAAKSKADAVVGGGKTPPPRPKSKRPRTESVRVKEAKESKALESKEKKKSKSKSK